MRNFIVVVVLVSFTLGWASSHKEVDDWDYNVTQEEELFDARTIPSKGLKLGVSGSNILPNSLGFGREIVSAPAPMMRNKTIGFSVGGAKDTNNLFENIKNGYLPKLSSITYEGQFYSHYFDTGIGMGECKALFCPSYSKAVVKNILPMRRSTI